MPVATRPRSTTARTCASIRRSTRTSRRPAASIRRARPATPPGTIWIARKTTSLRARSSIALSITSRKPTTLSITLFTASTACKFIGQKQRRPQALACGRCCLRSCFVLEISARLREREPSRFRKRESCWPMRRRPRMTSTQVRACRKERAAVEISPASHDSEDRSPAATARRNAGRRA